MKLSELKNEGARWIDARGNEHTIRYTFRSLTLLPSELAQFAELAKKLERVQELSLAELFELLRVLLRAGLVHEKEYSDEELAEMLDYETLDGVHATIEAITKAYVSFFQLSLRDIEELQNAQQS